MDLFQYNSNEKEEEIATHSLLQAVQCQFNQFDMMMMINYVKFWELIRRNGVLAYGGSIRIIWHMFRKYQKNHRQNNQADGIQCEPKKSHHPK